MFQELGRNRLKNLRRVLQWINIPSISIVYFCVISYFIIFRFSWFLVAVLSLSLVSFIWHNGIYLWLKLSLILLVFSSSCLIIRYKEARSFTYIPKVTQISPILDTIQVDGDQVSFRGKAAAQIYQVYYHVPTQNLKNYFQKIDKPILLTISATAEHAPTNRNFNGFNYQNYLKTQNIYNILSIDQVYNISENESWSVSRLRRKLILFCQTKFPFPLATYMSGLLFGYFGQSFDEMQTIYSQLGIIHFFTLSGLQVSFLFNVLRNILLRLGIQRHHVTKIQVPLGFIYAGLSGGSVSVVRALIQRMLTAFGITSLNNFSLTLLLLFIWQPKCFLTTGGALSVFFAFVVSMVAHQFKHKPKAKNNLIMMLLLTTASLPLLMLSFYSFQPITMILAVPLIFILVKIIMPCLSIIFLLAIATGINFSHLNFSFIWLETLFQWLTTWLPPPIVTGKPSMLSLIVMFISIGVLIDRWSNKKIRAALLLLLFGVCFFTKYPMTESITVVDIGQGDSIFLQDRFNQHTILIDTGGKIDFMLEKKWQRGAKKATAERTLIPYLKSIGIGYIDTLVITHTDADHIGDLFSVLANIPIKKIVVSQGSLTNQKFLEQLKQTKTQIQVAEVGQRFPIFDSYLEVLYPLLASDGKNNDSIVLYGVLYNTRFLFTGDLESEGEATLLKAYPSLSVDVLKAGHHGSKTSSSKAFVQKIRPTVALISCGLNNRYRHPNQETLDTFQNSQVAVYRTDQQGAIKLEKKGKSWQIKTVK